MNVELALPDLIKVHPAQRRDRRPSVDGDVAAKLGRVDIENSAGVVTIGVAGILVEVERELQMRRSRAAHRIETRGHRWRKRFDHRRDLSDRGCRRTER